MAKPRGFEFVASSVAWVLAAGCGGGDTGAPMAPVSPSQDIGPAGGTVDGPNGAQVVIPPGALAAATPIAITAYSGGAPGLPSGSSTVAPLLVFLPHATAFAKPVTVSMPFDTAQVPVGSAAALYKTNAAGTWERVANSRLSGAAIVGDATSFSWFAVTTPAPGMRRFIVEVTGSGRVRSDPDSSAIFCGNVDPSAPATDCEEIYPNTTAIRFAAEPYGFGSEFLGWRGDCVGNARVYAMTMAGDRYCRALFDGNVGAEPSPGTISLRAGGRAQIALNFVRHAFTGGDARVTLAITQCPDGLRCAPSSYEYRFDNAIPVTLGIEAIAPAIGTHRVEFTTTATRVDGSFVTSTSNVSVVVFQ